MWVGGSLVGMTPSRPMFSPHPIQYDHTRIVCGSVCVWFPHLITCLKLTKGDGWREKGGVKKYLAFYYYFGYSLNSPCFGGVLGPISRCCPQCDALWLTVRKGRVSLLMSLAFINLSASEFSH